MNKMLISHIIDCYGSSLQPFVARSSFDQFSMPGEAREFLKSFGLPPEGPLLLHFYPDGEELAVYTEGQKGVIHSFLIIGNDFGTDLGLKEHTGEVISVDTVGPLPTRFVNSSIFTMLAFLEIYSNKQPELGKASDEEASAIVAEMRSAMDGVDAKALDAPENWWSTILQQIEQGLL